MIFAEATNDHNGSIWNINISKIVEGSLLVIDATEDITRCYYVILV